MTKLRVGVIGLGFIGRAHVDALRRLPLLADAAVDVVHNCTPNDLHFAINRTAVGSAKPCFSEKPLTVHSAEAAELAALSSVG